MTLEEFLQESNLQSPLMVSICLSICLSSVCLSSVSVYLIHLSITYLSIIYHIYPSLFYLVCQPRVIMNDLGKSQDIRTDFH